MASPAAARCPPAANHSYTAPDQVARLRLPEIREAEEKLRVISQERELRVLYEQREKAARDKAAYEKDWQCHWLDEGKRLGIDEGKRLGIDEGRETREGGDLCAGGRRLSEYRRAG